MATLSSDRCYYDASLETLRELYLARGYPLHEVNGWLRKHAESRWINRLAPREESTQSGLLVLKTRFNPVWDFINIHSVHDAVKLEWEKEFTSIESTLRQLTLMDVGVRSVPAPHRRKRRVRKAVFLGATLASVGEVISESEEEQSESEDPFGGRLPDKRRCIEAERKESQSLGRDANARTRLAKLTQAGMLVSRKRALTLGDLAATWRKVVLAYDEDKTYLAPRYIEQFWHQ
ncbi:hypothetical protein RSOL_299300, partial [Rhizoctonia solani AG-3 Rhs1AP]